MTTESLGPYRDLPEIPPCAQHDIVMVLDEDGGAEVWCPVCEKLWWSGRKSTFDFWSDVYRIISEMQDEVVRDAFLATARPARLTTVVDNVSDK